MRDPSVRPGTVADQTYLVLCTEILAGRMGPDARLTEMTIAERLGISRTPVREAVRRLIIEGFLTRDRREGLRVTTLNPDEVQQIFNIRLMLEGYAARRAAEFVTPGEAAELTRLADVMTALAPPPKTLECSSSDKRRHMAAWSPTPAVRP